MRRRYINTGVSLMVGPRYIVFYDGPEDPALGWTADQFAEAIRFPLRAIGVRVVRQRAVGSTSPLGAFQARGYSRSQYDAMFNMVDRVVVGVINSLSGKN
jgi:hypothetical protein